MNKYFKKNGFVVIKKAISKELADFCFEYLKIKAINLQGVVCIQKLIIITIIVKEWFDNINKKWKI